MRAGLRRLATASLRIQQQDGGLSQAVQPPWERMAAALGRPLSASATPCSPQETIGAAAQQQTREQQQALLPPPPPPPPHGWALPRRSRNDRELKDRVLSFAERVFAADLDATEEEQAAAAASSSAGVAAPEEAFATAAEQGYRRGDKIRQRRAKKLAASGLGSHKPFSEWLETNAEGVAAFRELAQRRGLAPACDALLAFIYSAHKDFLLQAVAQEGTPELEAAAPGAADAASAPAQQAAHALQQEQQQLEVMQQPQDCTAASSSSSGSSSSRAGIEGGTADAEQHAAEPAPGQAQQREQQEQHPGQQAEEEPPLQAASQARPQPRLRAEAALDALERALAPLRLPRGSLAQLLRRRPSLLASPPAEEALAALAGALGGRAALADAALRSPSVLQSSPGTLQRRIEALVLHAHCPDPAVAARMVAQHPHLLAVPERQIAENARFLGSLLPARPYATLIERFPGLLSVHLEGTLRSLQRRAPPRLARVDMTLLASQQPTLLLAGSRGVLAAWAELEAACEGVPAWAAELEALTQPVASAAQLSQEARQRRAAEAEAAQQRAEQRARQQAAQQAKQAGRAPEADAWLQDAYRSAGADGGGGSSASGAAAPAVPALPAIHEQPSWFHQDPKAAAAAEEPGAYGTLRRPWQEHDRLRVRALARLLDARPWQRLVSCQPWLTRPAA
ncbi:hypothetical protein ABPG75_002798 [Micractinium tetrahymenae]